MNHDAKSGRREDARFLIPAVGLLLGIGLFQVLLGERLPVNHGLGWDGRVYARAAEEPLDVLLKEGLDAYRLQRIAPSGIVHLILRVLGIPRDDDHVVDSFAVYNLALLVATLFVWVQIAHVAGIGEGGRWLGFLLLFVNYANLKNLFYIPVSTDTTALFLGALLLYFFLRSSGLGMLSVLLIGAFTWPPFLVMGGLLYVFRRRPLDGAASVRHGLHWVVAILLALVFLVSLYGNMNLDLRPDGSEPVDKSALWISVLIALAYIVIVAHGLLKNDCIFEGETYRRQLDPRRALAWLVVVVFVHAIVGFLAKRPGISNASLFLHQLPARPVVKPGLFLVAHFVYFGVVVLILILYWRNACRRIHDLGVGWTLFVGALLALGLAPESRQIIHGLPALVLVAVMAVEDIRWPRWGHWILALLAIAASKIWLPINHEGPIGLGQYLRYPSQYYFMNHGPWMSYETFRLQGSLALLGLVVMYLVARQSQPILSGEREKAYRLPLAAARILVGAGCLALCSLGVEVASRYYLSLASGGNEGDGARHHATLGWEHEPGARLRLSRSEYTLDLQFNSKGLRGPERAFQKPPGTKRVLLLGGSFAEGYTVSEEATARSVLEQLLDRSACGSLEVLNGGVAGYATYQEYLFFKTEGHRYEPDIVVLFFFSGDLFRSLRTRRGEPAFNPTGDPGLPQREPSPSYVPLRNRELSLVPLSLWHRSATLRLFSNTTMVASPKLRRLLAASGLVELMEPPGELWPYGPRAEVEEMWRRTKQLLSSLETDVARHGGRLLLFYVPARFEVNDTAWTALLRRYGMNPRFWRREKVWNSLARAADELGIQVIDPRGDLRQAELSGRPAYLGGEELWTAEGNQIAAAELARFLRAAVPCH